MKELEKSLESFTKKGQVLKLDVKVSYYYLCLLVCNYGSFCSVGGFIHYWWNDCRLWRQVH